MTEPHYDPETCVYAGELRARGLSIPNHIPDRAWIQDYSWALIGPVSVEVDKDDEKLFHFDMGDFVFTRPFRWIEGTLTKVGYTV